MENRQEQFDLIFDYLSGQNDRREEVEKLIASDDRARQVYNGLRSTFAQLDLLNEIHVPVGLADRTAGYVQTHQNKEYTIAMNEAKARIHKHEFQNESRFSWVMGNLRDMIAVAACLMLVFLVGKPGLDHSRSIAQRKMCEKQMAELGGAFTNYASDNNDQLPQAGTNGGKWWNIGEQRPEASSNTRHVYKLVKGGYTRPENFICPASDGNQQYYAQLQKMSDADARKLNDFLSKDHVNYSFKLIIPNSNAKWGISREAIAADKNPIFAGFDSRLQHVVSVPADSALRKVNSRNHGSKGQVVLFSDGSIVFMKDRFYGPQQDDIFTIKKAIEYYGVETPEEDDTFIAP